jgi:ATP-dependent DNA helicase RecG
MSAAPSQPPASALARSVTSLFGIGPERAALLGRLGVHTIEDLLLHRPHRYEDRQNLLKIGELQLREPASTHGTIVALGTKWYRHHSKSIFEIILEDGTGRLHCRWWNLPYMEKYFAKGNEVLVFGKPILLKPRTIDHPETEVLEGGEENFIHLNRITPIYPLTEGLGQRWLRALIWHTLQALEAKIQDPWPPDLMLPPASGLSLPSRSRAMRHTHFPEKSDQIEPARKRLALDEFVELQSQIQARRKNFELKAQGLPCGGDNCLIKPFLKHLEFKLTPSQTQVLREIRNDMSSPHPMRRLLQGDVGSGKTVVAACTALMALESGFNVALMAPTEILAEQHFSTFSNWFKPLKIAVILRTGSQKSPETRRDSAEDTPGEQLSGKQSSSSGGPPIITIGTHALIHSGFNPENLGLVIIDEQHRFGVIQREQLLRKGYYPHLLVMTATPIPRTLGLTLYGDLDVSVIDQLPPGRGQIKTFVRTADRLPKVWEFLRGKLSEGRQAYVVYPHVEENGQLGIKAVTGEFENLQRLLAPFRVGILHGRLRPQEKEQVMKEFRAQKLQVLLATSIIEVGVDVANASVMLVENAEQFGLAQLHQLRGRIGRGAHESFCILVAGAKTKAAQQRLRALEETTDGFCIAEADLKLRGPGELLGQQQSGMPRFRFGDLVNDLALINQARQIAKRII